MYSTFAVNAEPHFIFAMHHWDITDRYIFKMRITKKLRNRLVIVMNLIFKKSFVLHKSLHEQTIVLAMTGLFLISV